MLLRYTTRKLLTKSAKILFIEGLKVAGALVKLNCITQYSKELRQVLNAVRFSYPLAIETR